jgi:hypothetical protein
MERNMKTRDRPVGARYVGDAGHYDIRLRIYVRSAKGETLPSKRDVENKISDLLLAQKRLDDGAKWDVSATSIPDEDDAKEPELFHEKRHRRRLRSREDDDSHPRFMRRKGQATRPGDYEG